MIAFISTLTEASTMFTEILIDFALYNIVAGIIGWILFGKQKKKAMTKAFFSLMIVAPLLFLVIHFNG